MEKSFIGKRIAFLRNAKKISARNMSLELGQSSEYINQIENGRSLPSIEGLINICEFLNISLSDFFDEQSKYPLQYKELFTELNNLDSLELEQVTNLIKLINRKK